MFSVLFEWLGHQLQRMWYSLNYALWLFYMIAVTWLYFAWKGVILMVSITTVLLTKFDDINAYFGGQSSPSQPSDTLHILAIANTFFPLDELFRVWAGYLTFVVLPISVYRFIKSWIPGGLAAGS